MNLVSRSLLALGLSVAAAPLVFAGAVGLNPGAHMIPVSRVQHGWFGSTITGSGNMTTQTRAVGNFDSIELQDSTDAEIVIGSPASVQVRADDNLLELIDTEVHGGSLVVDSHGSYDSRDAIKVLIRVPSLKSIHLQGSGDVDLRGAQGDTLKIGIEGSGDVKAQGAVQSLEVRIAGSGDAQLADLRSTDADVEIDGSGDADVTVAGTLHARVNGSGDISYGGRPHDVYDEKSGSGDIRRR